LTLSNNQLTAIPAHVLNSSVILLELQHNQITSIPDSITQKYFLYFWAFDNRLTSIPNSLVNCRFYNLFLDYNQITSLPATIGNLRTDYLRLQHNQLTSLPASFGNIQIGDGYKDLDIDLSYNQLASLPLSIGNCIAGGLFLSYNRLISLPDTICAMPKLSWFRVDHNLLTDIPDRMTGESYHESIAAFDYNQLCNLSTAKVNWLNALYSGRGLQWRPTQDCGGVVQIEEAATAPAEFTLLQNMPNPFNPSTVISFTIPSYQTVTLKVFSAQGVLVWAAAEKAMEAGIHSVEWNASGMPSGIYYYKLIAGQFTATKKCILIK
jgi:Leucine-rich repeat (LRR) protein